MVGYSGKNACIPRYECHRGRLDNMEAKCISFGGLSIDAAVSREILLAVQPSAVEASALVVTQEANRHEELLKTLQLELKAARYAAQLAQRQYNAVDPDNRLVASELERRWNVALNKASELEAKLSHEEANRKSEPTAPEGVQGLHHELESVWNAAETDLRLKKRIIRTLVEEILVEIDPERSEVDLLIHWKGGAHTTLRVQRRRRGEARIRTDTDVVEAVRQLSHVCTDKFIAAFLNRNGRRTARGNRWGAMAVTSLRNKRGISVHTEERQRAEGWMNLTEAAAHLGAAQKTVRRFAERGELEAMHPLDDGPWVFNSAALDAPDFRERLERLRENTPAGPDVRQLDLAISTTYRGEAQ